MKKYLEAGQIVGTHGLIGEMRVQPWTDTPEIFAGIKIFYLDPEGQNPVRVLRSRPHKNIVILQAEGVETIPEAERYRGRSLYASREDFNVADGSYFIQDLIGCQVRDADTGEIYGELAKVSKTGANDVWHIKKDGREYLIPAIPEVVHQVDIISGRVEIRPLKGIFDNED